MERLLRFDKIRSYKEANCAQRPTAFLCNSFDFDVSGAVKAFGPGLSPDGVKVKSNADFTVDPRPAGGKPQPLVVTCADATGEPVPVQVTSRPDGTFACRYNPQKPEKHTVCVTYGGASVPGSPFRVSGKKFVDMFTYKRQCCSLYRFYLFSM